MVTQARLMPYLTKKCSLVNTEEAEVSFDKTIIVRFVVGILTFGSIVVNSAWFDLHNIS